MEGEILIAQCVIFCYVGPVAKVYQHIWNVFFVMLFLGFGVVHSGHARGLVLGIDEEVVQKAFTEVLSDFEDYDAKLGIHIRYTGLISMADSRSGALPSFVVTETHPEKDTLLRQEKYLLSNFRYSLDQNQIEGFDLARVAPKLQGAEKGIIHLSKQKNHWIEVDRVDRNHGQKKLRFSLNAKQAAQMTSLLGKLQR